MFVLCRLKLSYFLYHPNSFLTERGEYLCEKTSMLGIIHFYLYYNKFPC